MPWMQSKPATASPKARSNAPALRRNLTPPEKRLWRLLRERLPLDGTHFRRQVALGPYVADFVCLKARLIIEVDGEQHGSDQAQHYDAERTAWLEENSFTVMRFSNRQIMTEAEMVLDTVFAALSGQLESCPPTPHPQPLPTSGRAGAQVIHG